LISLPNTTVPRFLPEPVPPQDQALGLAVPDGEGEHALQPSRQRRRLEILGQVGDDLGVPRRLELVAGPAQLGAQGGEVVYLAVQRDPDRAVLVGDRRVAGQQVDDCQAGLADHAPAPGEEAGRVRPPVTQVA
jgi:hypothetical protein